MRGDENMIDWLICVHLITKYENIASTFKNIIFSRPAVLNAYYHRRSPKILWSFSYTPGSHTNYKFCPLSHFWLQTGIFVSDGYTLKTGHI